jgi:hypothetical protein
MANRRRRRYQGFSMGANRGRGVAAPTEILECRRQRAQFPSEIRELVLDDQRLRNEKW